MADIDRKQTDTQTTSYVDGLARLGSLVRELQGGTGTIIEQSTESVRQQVLAPRIVPVEIPSMDVPTLVPTTVTSSTSEISVTQKTNSIALDSKKSFGPKDSGTGRSIVFGRIEKLKAA